MPRVSDGRPKAGIIATGIAAAIASFLPAAAAGNGPLEAQPPIAVPRKPGYFDYMSVDAKYRRLLVAHSANDTLAIVDMDAGTLISQVDLGDGAGGAGVAVDVRDGKYFVGTANNKVVDINRKNMVLQANIATPGPVDGIAFDPNNDTLYADEDHGKHVWAINGKTDKLIATIDIPGKPEYVDFDPVSNRVYQNIEPEPASVFAIDPTTNTIAARWPVAPATRVHGLAIDGASGRVFSIGINGKLAVVDVKSGAIVTTVDVASRVDQIVFDPGTRRVYCPSGTGIMSVVQETDAGATLVGTVSIPRGTHTITVDPKTHAVWISYGGVESDYVEKFTPNPTP
jgi:DNA-binding beta-propeller fold protein YncE